MAQEAPTTATPTPTETAAPTPTETAAPTPTETAAPTETSGLRQNLDIQAKWSRGYEYSGPDGMFGVRPFIPNNQEILSFPPVGQPEGAIISGENNSELLVPGEGTWKVTDEGKNISFYPSPELGMGIPSPISFYSLAPIADSTTEDSSLQPASLPATITTVLPAGDSFPTVRLFELYPERSSTFQNFYDFTYTPEFFDFVDPSTYSSKEFVFSDDKSSITFPGEGVWIKTNSTTDTRSIYFIPEEGFIGTSSIQVGDSSGWRQTYSVEIVENDPHIIFNSPDQLITTYGNWSENQISTLLSAQDNPFDAGTMEFCHDTDNKQYYTGDYHFAITPDGEVTVSRTQSNFDKSSVFTCVTGLVDNKPGPRIALEYIDVTSTPFIMAPNNYFTSHEVYGTLGNSLYFNLFSIYNSSFYGQGTVTKPIHNVPTFFGSDSVDNHLYNSIDAGSEKFTLDRSTDDFSYIPSLPAGSEILDNGKTLKVPGEGTWKLLDRFTAQFIPEVGFTGLPTPVFYTGSLNGVESTPGAIGAGLVYESYHKKVAADSGHTLQQIGIIGESTTFDIYPIISETNPSYDSPVNQIPNKIFFVPTGLPAGSLISNQGKKITIPGEGIWTLDITNNQESTRDESGEIIDTSITRGISATFTPEPGFVGNPTSVKYIVDSDYLFHSINLIPGTLTAVYSNNSETPLPEPTQPVEPTPDPTPTAPVTTIHLPGGINGAIITFASDSQPASSAPTSDGKTLVVPGEGTWTLLPSGTFTFVPEEGFTGTPQPVKIQVTSPDGSLVTYWLNVSGEALPIGVLPEPTQPVEPTPDPTPTAPVTTINLPGGINGAIITFASDSQPASSAPTSDGKTLVVPGEGTWTLLASGTFTFVPEEGFTGTPQPVKIQVTSPDGSLVTYWLNVSGEALPIGVLPEPTQPAEQSPEPTQPVAPTPEATPESANPTSPEVEKTESEKATTTDGMVQAPSEGSPTESQASQQPGNPESSGAKSETNKGNAPTSAATGNSDSSGNLAQTGAPVALLTGIGTAILGAGAALLSRRRKHD